MFKSFFKEKAEADKTIFITIKSIIGSKPKNLDLYKLAVRHASISKESNERLEFLGDAILGAVIADYLFKKYPYKDEGFLTEIRSRIVKRDSLNALALRIGLNKIVEYQSQGASPHAHKSLYGNALEAFIGAVYLDKGYKKCETFILKQLIKPHVDLKEIVSLNNNFKSTLIEWAQKGNKDISFEIIKEAGNNHSKKFTAQVVIDNEPISSGTGHSKKKAEQSAAQYACEKLLVK